MKLSIEVDKQTNFSREILKEFIHHINKILNTAEPVIQDKIRQIITSTFKGSAFFNEVSSGEIRQKLLVSNPTFVLGQIENNIITNIKVSKQNFAITGNTIKGKF